MQVGPFLGGCFVEIGEERERTEGLDEPNDILAVAGPLLRRAEVESELATLRSEDSLRPHQAQRSRCASRAPVGPS